VGDLPEQHQLQSWDLAAKRKKKKKKIQNYYTTEDKSKCLLFKEETDLISTGQVLNNNGRNLVLYGIQ
jgi:hypothetical protein